MDEDDLAQRADRRIEQASAVYERHGRVFHVVWVGVAVVVVLAGLAMVVVPGPATVVVPAGLAMLAVVFGWARRALLRSLEAGVEAKEQVAGASTSARVLLALAAAAAVAAVAVALLW